MTQAEAAGTVPGSSGERLAPPRPAPRAAAPRTWPWQPPTLPPHAAASARPRIAEEGRWRCRGDAIFEPPGFAACAPVRPSRGVRGPEVSGTRKWTLRPEFLSPSAVKEGGHRLSPQGLATPQQALPLLQASLGPRKNNGGCC